MSIVCPTVTCQSEDLHEYRRQMERIEFANRIQIDLMDGIFTPTKSPEIDDIWVFEDKKIDIHLMYKNPSDVLNQLIDLKPNLVIIHAESDVHIPTFAGALSSSGIKFGIALLKDTAPSEILDYIQYIDHALIFSGDLGKFGGVMDPRLIRKATQLKQVKPEVEIGWDGGVNEKNVRELADGGIDVINVGGYIQNAENPSENYQILVNLLQS